MDLVVHNARVMTCDPNGIGLGSIDHGAIVIERGIVKWVGPDGARPRSSSELNADGRLVTPGFIDCHTHAIFAGDRAHEFAMRAAGHGYLAIAEAGGGINATLGPTRSASEAELEALMEARLDRAQTAGTTTIEVKSGYDLTVGGEIRLLRCIKGTGSRRAQRIVPTLLAHLVPAERVADRDVYVTELCDQLIPAAARGKLAKSVDVYCDEGAFTLDETGAILRAAKAAGLAVRGHVGQFSDLGAAELLAELGALSADHVEQISDDGIAQLAAAGTIGVMLPGACVQLRLPVPPVAKMRAAGMKLAIATDLDPGSSNCETLAVQMWLATTHYAMTVEEAWLGVTRHAASALGLQGPGMLVPGSPADFILWNTDDPIDVPYRYGTNLVERVHVAGVQR